ncbi:MAG: integrase core domain-containing protein [Pelovirga sp.]
MQSTPLDTSSVDLGKEENRSNQTTLILSLFDKWDFTTSFSDHFLNQLKFWRITPSFAFVAQPQTNGVAERFNRTLKEQAIHGRLFRNVDEVREAVKSFVDIYNREWRVEENAFKVPSEIRHDWHENSQAA